MISFFNFWDPSFFIQTRTQTRDTCTYSHIMIIINNNVLIFSVFCLCEKFEHVFAYNNKILHNIHISGQPMHVFQWINLELLYSVIIILVI